MFTLASQVPIVKNKLGLITLIVWFFFIILDFVTIATILGTGILGMNHFKILTLLCMDYN